MVQMLKWKIWQLCDGMVHGKPVPSVESTWRFLCSHLVCLCILSNAIVGSRYFLREKSLLFLHCRRLTPIIRNPNNSLSSPPHGWAALTVCRSVIAQDSRAGAAVLGWLFLLHVDRLLLRKHFGGTNLVCKGGAGTHTTLGELTGHFPVTRKR